MMPAFNAASTITRSINSVLTQTHPSWKLVIIDDMSTDNTPEIIERLADGYGLGPDRLQLIRNTEKKWEIANVLEGLNHCESDDIICRLDGDDWLCDSDVLTILNYRYEQEGLQAAWTAHRWGFSHHNISGPLPRDANPYEHQWVSSHLKTFRKSLLDNVDDKNYRNEDGEYFKRIGDQVFYLPALHQAAGNWHFEPMVAYHYTIDMQPETFQTDDAKFQKDEAEQLRARGFLS